MLKQAAWSHGRAEPLCELQGSAAAYRAGAWQAFKQLQAAAGLGCSGIACRGLSGPSVKRRRIRPSLPRLLECVK